MNKPIFKKITLLVISLCILLSPINIFAAGSDQYLIRQMELTIEKEIEIARQNIYEQLDRQDALILMEVYEDIIYPEIERQIMDEYINLYNLKDDSIAPYSSQNITRSSSYSAPNGGVLTYLSPMPGYRPTEVAITYLNESDSYDFVLGSTSFTIRDLIYSIIGYIPILGDISSFILDIGSHADSLARRQIANNGRCAKIINTYSREFGTEASLVTGWSERFQMVAPAGAYSIVPKRF